MLRTARRVGGEGLGMMGRKTARGWTERVANKAAEKMNLTSSSRAELPSLKTFRPSSFSSTRTSTSSSFLSQGFSRSVKVGALGVGVAGGMAYKIYEGQRLEAEGVAVPVEEVDHSFDGDVPPPSSEPFLSSLDELRIKNRSLLQRIGQMLHWMLRVFKSMVLFTPLAMTLPIVKRLKEDSAFRKLWLRSLVWSMGSMGSCFIKLGQWAATRVDLFPPDACRAMSELHSGAPTHSFSHSKRLVEESFGKSLVEIFETFETQPLASGAIAQIHKATLLGTGEVVAVKVRHPNVVQTILQDLSSLEFLTDALCKVVPSLVWMDLQGAVKNFSKSMRDQLNLEVEAENLLAFSSNFSTFPSVIFPRPIPGLYCPEVLVETFEEGVPISDYLKIHQSKSKRKEDVAINKHLAALGFNAYLKMLLIDNFVHADLHPGNILVREKTDRGPEIVLLDVGLVAKLCPREKRNLVDLLTAVALGDGKRGAQLMIERSRGETQAHPEYAEKFRVEIEKLFIEATSRPLSEIEIGHMFGNMMRICRECHVQLEGNFSTMATGMIVIEGLARQLNADFDVIKEAGALLCLDREMMNAFMRAKLSDKWLS
eukprot:TRINITY_DN4859_c0_g1_i3.p1 TRINITY_DN4859_c0_g1~~TRINITY_DN4859_c0_g1_i3.p1  ORF type:complete len:597 (+),score=210.13 TRINITY_DN4859_c0_g1_i3:65-1855(+)